MELTEINQALSESAHLRTLIESVARQVAIEFSKTLASAHCQHDDIPLDENKAAVFLGVKPQTLALWRHKGKGPRYIKSGSNVRYDRADLLNYRESRKVAR